MPEIFEEPVELFRTLASEIALRLTEAVAERGEASFVATGGSTPGPLYDALAQEEAPWDRVWVTLTDERWLTAEHPESNERLVRERLLQGPAASAHFAPLLTEDPSPAEAREAVDARVAALPRPFDVVLLGMGADGHFASLFPGNPALGEALDLILAANVIPIEAPGAAGSSQRMSLTLGAILDARWIAILIRGQEKLDLVRRPDSALPIAAVLSQDQVPVTVFWAP